MMNIFRVSVLSSTVLLAACNFAPKYEAPESPISGEYKVSSSSTAMTAADLGWQSFFKDERLKRFIALGLANNRDLLTATKNVEIAKKQYGIQLSNLFPSVGLSGTQSAQNLPADMNASGMRDISRSYIAGIGISSYELDFFGKIRNQNEAALQSYFSTEQAQRTAHINLVASIANTYFSLRSLEEMEKLLRETVSSYESTYQMTHARFKAGVASMLDVNQAKSILDSARATLVSTQRNKEQTINALELLIAQPLPADLPKGSKFGSDVLVDNIPAGLPSDLLTRRPDIIAAEHDLKASNANIGAARAAFFPSISLTALLGVASMDLGNLFGSGRDAWTFNPSITMPLYSFGALKNSLDVAKLRKEVQILNYEKTVQTAFSEVNDALIGVETYKQQLDALSSQIKAAEESLRLSTLRYTSGIDSFLSVQSAQVNVLNTKQNFLLLALASLQNKVTLYKALGGGWSATDVVKNK